jgi:predicted dehydrogenase
MPKGTRLGIVGAGAVALDHAAAAAALGARVSAASTRSERSPRWAAFKTAYPDCAFEPDPAAMAERGDVDAVVLCLPWKAQAAWLDWGLSARKPVLIEKPIALAAPELRAALERHRATLAGKLVGYNRRYYRTVERLAERLAQGGLRAADITISEEVARLVRVHGEDMLPYAMEHSGCHLIDLAVHLFGPLSVARMMRRRERQDGVAFDGYNGLLETGAGVPIAFFANANDPSRVGIRCKFDDGTFWCLTPPEILTVYKGYDIVERSPECQVKQYAPREAEKLVEDAALRPGFLAQMRAFLTGDFGPGCTPAMALGLLDLVAAIKSQARDIAA